MTQTLQDVRAEIVELGNQITGKLNSFDSKTERADTLSLILNQLVANVELSKIEKAGVLAYLMDKRIRG